MTEKVYLGKTDVLDELAMLRLYWESEGLKYKEKTLRNRVKRGPDCEHQDKMIEWTEGVINGFKLAAKAIRTMKGD